MSAYPRWLELEIAAMEHGEPIATPPHDAAPTEGETTMRACSKCGKEVRASRNGETHVDCNHCRRGLTPQSKAARAVIADPDDAVLERVEASSVKPPPPAKRVKTVAPVVVPGDVEEFFTLASALGLEPQSMLDTWCREWVEKTRARALGTTPFTVVGPAGTVSASAMPLATIGEDYEKAREQAEAAES